MTAARWVSMVRKLRDDIDAETPDSELLARFARQNDEAAFTRLVERHGAMVWGVCRRTLGDGPDVEDAFQATFLVLIGKAATLTRCDRLAAWLHGVALRVARKARFSRTRRYVVERPIGNVEPEMRSPPDPDVRDWLDVELASLSDNYRTPLILCELEGLSRREAAARLDLPEGTLSSRLARGRRLLRDRLTRRGVNFAFTVLAVPSVPLPAVVSSRGGASAGAVFLSQGVMQSMLAIKLKIGILALILATAPIIGLQIASPGYTAEVAETPQEPRPPERLPQPDDPVAVIFSDQPLTRAELGEFLIARCTPKQLEHFVNRQILEGTCAQQGVTVSDEEVQAEMTRQFAALGITREQFIDEVLPNYGKTLWEWEQDVVACRLMLAKLTRQQIPVSEADLQEMFEQLREEAKPQLLLK